ncbi:MAG TPA: AAA family ATPase [Pirellulales bacterium]|nr:AAA family ATPase [Pirellulales bacterium]
MIRIRSLSIKNFRGVREGRIDGFTDVNVLVGRNNSGKTTVVEAITRAAMGSGLQNDLFGRPVEQFWQQARAGVTPGDAQSLLWYRQDTSNDVDIVGVVDDDDGARKSEELVYRMNMSPQGAGMTAHPRLNQSVQGSTALEAAKRQLFCAGITVFRPADAFNSGIEENCWRHLLSDRRDRLLTETLNEVFGLDAESFQLLPANHLMVLFQRYGLPLDLQGDGTRAAMRTLMTLAMLKSTLLMLEEPECHQHPGSLERFASALCRLAKARAVQLIVSTHSAECVRSFLKAASAAHSDAAVFHLTLDDGKQDARRLDPEAVEALTDTGVDVRFLDLYA